ncbi:MAG: glycine--tRNA ligase [Candidatus Aenigmarchaeota archaeon]|nr:glycine--tRNA ligase [Candidatus Aenigmarchaeota archaeon]
MAIDIEDLAKRRGFFWRSSELYGGISGFYDYAHLGFMVKKKWENQWRNFFIRLDENYYEIQPCQTMTEEVFQASGHLASFVDPIAKCKKCGFSERADHILEDRLHETFEGISSEDILKLIKKHNIRCSKCKGELSEVGELNLMFPVKVGTGKDARQCYLSPETAQGAYVNFLQEFHILRRKLPLGLAIIGKAFRNEISPRNALIRMREFTQAELQIFFDPDTINEHPKFDEIKNTKLRLFLVKNRGQNKIMEMPAIEVVEKIKIPKFYVYHLAKIQEFYTNIMEIPPEKFRFRELSEEERAFYNKYHFDIELDIPDIGFKEVAGLHYRTDHDLAGHEKISKQSQNINIEGKKFIPHVLEISMGVDRNVFAILSMFCDEEKTTVEINEQNDSDRIVLRFPRRISTFDSGIFPLLKKQGLDEKAKQVKNMLSDEGFSVFYDEAGSIGRRYRRIDEIGVPLGITIDHQTLEDSTVTIRDRDTMKQVRVEIKNLVSKLRNYFKGESL